MAPLVQSLLLLLLAASLAHASPLSLRAAVLSPSTALLTWTAGSSVGPILLSVPSLPSPLSLPSSAGASTHLLLTDLTLSEPMQITLSSSCAASDAGLGLGSSESVHVSLSPWPRVGPAAWDLSGARLSPRLACADASCAAHRVSWAAAPVSADPHAPPLLYSVFAEWSALTASAASDATAESTAGSSDASRAAPQPTIRRQSIRMCTTQAKSVQQQQAHTNQRRLTEQTAHADEQDRTVQLMHCDIAADRLPRGVELTLHLITECDYHRIDGEAGASLPHCLTAISPELRVTIDALRPEASLPAAVHPVSFTAAPGIAQVANDTAVRQALCTFFNQTSGPQWNNPLGWCNPDEPICPGATHAGWAGVGCDSTGQFITSLILFEFRLASNSPVGVDISPLFTVIDQLVTLDLSGNGALWLSRLDLSPLANLTSLSLPSRNRQGPGTEPLILPHPSCQLDSIDLKYTTFVVAIDDWSACTRLTQIDISQVQSSFPFVLITWMPLLQQFTASGAALSGDAVGSYGGGLTGGELTSFILAHLNESNPQLQSLDLSECPTLPFGRPNATDNWPHIVAPALTTLLLDGLGLRTGPQGPADQLWLQDMPSLTLLSMVRLPSVTVHTSAFLYAARSLQSWSCPSLILGDLAPLFSLSSLRQLQLTGTGLRSALPFNMSAVWPGLQSLYCSGCNLFGALPDFRQLPALMEIVVDGNSLEGHIDPDFAADSLFLTQVTLSSNRLHGPLPHFCGSPYLISAAFDSNLIDTFPAKLSCYGHLRTLQLQSNPMRGELPADLWEQLPLIQNLGLSNTLINGSIPDRDPSLPAFNQFLASRCAFSGRLPRNIDAAVMDLSSNNFTGPLILFDEGFVRTPSITSLTLSFAGQLACPIQIGALANLQTLDISGNGFEGCAFANVTLPSSLTQLDISNNSWLPFDLQIPLSLSSLHASQANVRGILTDARRWPNLLQLTLDGNPFNPFGNSEGIPLWQQLGFLIFRLRSFSCQRCGLTLPFTDLMASSSPQASLEVFRLDGNELWGEFAFSFFAVLPLSITEFSVAGSSRLRGPLMSTYHALPDLTSLDFSSTSLAGPIPPSWTNLPALTRLNIANSSIQCDLSITAESTLQCADQTVVTASPAITIESTSLSDPATGVHCSALTIVATGSSSVTADPSYHWWTECRCDSASFGLNALCSRCPDGCTCVQDRIANCFPVVRRGSIAVNPASDASGSRPVVAGSIVAFSVAALLPCPRTVTGDSLCNPDGIAWPSFYRIVEQAGDASLSPSLADSDLSSSATDGDLSGWCAAGHTGRLCAACANDYFSSGRWCLKCLSEGVHVMILVANLMLICALIAYLYAKSPSAATSAKDLGLYVSRLARSSVLPAASQTMRELKNNASDSAQLSLSASPSFSSSDAAPAPVSEPANPLKLLIFHSQQLSLLLHTSTSLPPVMAGLLSALNSGSTGFSLSSLIAMECLSSWTLAARCWMVVAAPVLVGLAAAATTILSPRSGPVSNRAVPLVPRRPTNATVLRGRDEPLLRAEAEQSREDAAFVSMDEHAAAYSANGPASSSAVPRIYSVCVSLLYFLFFPCAQTVLSAVACTDTRESGRSYLNLYPDQSCDAEWRRTVLPPAVLGLLFWVVAFPLGSTLMLLRLRARVAGSEAASSGSAASASALSVWPICSDLLLPYSCRFWYWDQLLLVRRLLLVAAVTLIPASSLYLPLVLFAIIQLSALQQHWAQPYAHSLLNAGELASLYLLLINYISAIILQTGLTEGGFQQTANGWAAALFVVNAAFLLVLMTGLFGWARRRIATWFAFHRSKLFVA